MNAGRRILVLAPFAPRLDGMHGGSRTVAQLVVRLAERHRIALLVLRAADEPGVGDELQRCCEAVEEVAMPTVGSARAKVARSIRFRAALVAGTPTWATERTADSFAGKVRDFTRAWRPDVVQLEYRIMGQFLPALKDCAAPRVLTEYDAASVKRGRPGARASVFDSLEARAWRRLGRRATSAVDAVVVFTERDRRAVAGLGTAMRIEVIPLGWDVSGPPLDPVGKHRHGIVYVGSFIHPPNIDAALRLAETIFPRVRAHVGGATLDVVGSGPPRRLHELGVDGVTVAGEVPDVIPYLDRAAVVAAPIRFGGGMRVKVLEALAAGKALVASSIAVEGLDVTDGEHVILAETDDEFVAALVALLRDEDLRRRLAGAARRWAETNLSWESRVRAYEDLYSSLLAADTDVPSSAVSR